MTNLYDWVDCVYKGQTDDEEAPSLIKKPKKKKKQKGWSSYYRWWVSKQTISIWITYDASMPYSRQDRVTY